MSILVLEGVYTGGFLPELGFLQQRPYLHTINDYEGNKVLRVEEISCLDI